MKSDHHSEQLLNDIFQEDAPEAFEAAVWERTLGLVRRRRRWRHCQRALVVVAIGALLPLLFREPVELDLPQPVVVAPASRPFTFVATAPLNPASIVESQPGGVPFVSSSPGSLAVVESGSAQTLYQELTDDELLLLCKGRSVALVRPAPAHAELLFYSPGDKNGFAWP